MRDVYSPEKRKSTSIPALLLIFDRGLGRLPTVVPNGGNEEIDDLIVEWVRRKLLTSERGRAAA